MSAQPGNLVPPPPTTTVNNNGSNMKGNVCRMYKVQYCTCKAAIRVPPGPAGRQRRVQSASGENRIRESGSLPSFTHSLTHSLTPPCRVRGPGWSARTGMAPGGMAMACHGKAMQGKAKQGKATHVKSRHGKARPRAHTHRTGHVGQCRTASGHNFLLQSRNQQLAQKPPAHVFPATCYLIRLLHEAESPLPPGVRIARALLCARALPSFSFRHAVVRPA